MRPIEIENISKKYPPAVRALDSVSFSVRPGELFGLIGPDGAGKTSLIKILTTLLLPDGGSARVLGLDTVRDFQKIRSRIGYMPGRFSLYQDLSIEENLEFFASVFGTTIAKNYHLIESIYQQIEPFKKRRAGALSGGMKQKLALCCALIHAPEVLFLDEPTTGVDAVSRKEFWEMLDRLRAQGLTMLVSTPYMDEASRCDRVGLIQDGKLLGVDTTERLCAGFSRPIFSIKSSEKLRLLRDLRGAEWAVSCWPFGEVAHLVTAENGPKPVEIIDFLTKKGHFDISVEKTEAGIEDVFMDLMAKNETR